MVDVIRECYKIARSLRRSLERVQSQRINREETKNRVRHVVDAYFRADRPEFIKELRNEELLESLDAAFQELLSHTHTRTGKRRYIATVDLVCAEWQNLEKKVILQSPPTEESDAPLQGLERDLLFTLGKLCAPAATCYLQALCDLTSSNRTSWRGTATELRETLREVLDQLAPDDELQSQDDFTLAEGARGPTMKQKARFILKSRRVSESARRPVEDAIDLVDERLGVLVRSVYGGSSRSVHTEASKKDILSIKRFVETVLVELLEIDS